MNEDLRDQLVCILSAILIAAMITVIFWEGTQ